MDRGTGRRELEATLRASRERVERQVADGRVLVFAATVLLTVLIQLVVPGRRTWWPSAYFGAWTVIALGLRAVVRRVSVRRPLVAATLALDVAAACGIHVVMPWAVPDAPAGLHEAFLAYVTAPSLLLVLFINALRHDGPLAWIGSGLAVTAFLGLVGTLGPPGPPQVAAAGILAIAGGLSAFGTRETRRTLDTHARTLLLRRYLPAAAVERVMREDPDASMGLLGRAATVTVLSSDLRGFTAMSERLAPAEVLAQLNAYHGRMLQVIEAHGGMLDKFIGDGALAVFGLPLAGDAEPADHGAGGAVACAHALLDALVALNGERATRGLAPLAVGIGIHTGPVVAGNLGAPGRRLEFTVIGDTVNTAARLEGATKEAGVPVLVSAATAARLPVRDGLTERPPLALRGRAEPLAVFALAGRT